MRAVWSFWSKPFFAHRRDTWATPRHHLLAWVLSTRTAMRHHRPTVLVTDDAGARMLIDGIGLEVDEVSTALNALRRHDPEWWALGKLYAYRAQREPFVHLDSDVFLWKALPRDLECAPVLAQNPEYLTQAPYYRPEAMERALAGLAGSWLPGEWRWYRSSGRPQRAECCGIVGGTCVEFLRHYARQAIMLIEAPANRRGFARLNDKIGHNVLFEQYLLAACLDYHRAHAASPYHDVAIRYVFPSIDDAFDPERAARAGYTHLIADAKRNATLAARLEARVARDYPDDYARCLAYLERPTGAATCG